MQTITLYKYERGNGGVTVSPIQPDAEYTVMYRLVADDGKMLVNGDVITSCIDVESTDGWTETDEATEADYQAALAEFGVEV